jgi:hypothetical protein
MKLLDRPGCEPRKGGTGKIGVRQGTQHIPAFGSDQDENSHIIRNVCDRDVEPIVQGMVQGIAVADFPSCAG